MSSYKLNQMQLNDLCNITPNQITIHRETFGFPESPKTIFNKKENIVIPFEERKELEIDNDVFNVITIILSSILFGIAYMILVSLIENWNTYTFFQRYGIIYFIEFIILLLSKIGAFFILDKVFYRIYKPKAFTFFYKNMSKKSTMQTLLSTMINSIIIALKIIDYLVIFSQNNLWILVGSYIAVRVFSYLITDRIAESSDKSFLMRDFLMGLAYVSLAVGVWSFILLF